MRNMVISSKEQRLLASVKSQLDREPQRIAVAEEEGIRVSASLDCYYPGQPNVIGQRPWVIITLREDTRNEKRIVRDGFLIILRW